MTSPPRRPVSEKPPAKRSSSRSTTSQEIEVPSVGGTKSGPLIPMAALSPRQRPVTRHEMVTQAKEALDSGNLGCWKDLMKTMSTPWSISFGLVKPLSMVARHAVLEHGNNVTVVGSLLSFLRSLDPTPKDLLTDEFSEKPMSVLVSAAAIHETTELLELLAEYCGDFDIKIPTGTHGWSRSPSTALHDAAAKGRVANLKFIWGLASWDVDAPDSRANTPLAEAVMNDNIDAAKYLVSIGANPSYVNTFRHDRPSLVHLAAESESPRMIEWLVSLPGVDANVKNRLGESPLFSAISSRPQSLTTTMALVKAGADPTLANRSGQVALMNWKGKSPSVEVLMYLQQVCGDALASSLDYDGNTILHHAVRTNLHATPNLLQKISVLVTWYGISPHTRNKAGETPEETLMGAWGNRGPIVSTLRSLHDDKYYGGEEGWVNGSGRDSTALELGRRVARVEARISLFSQLRRSIPKILEIEIEWRDG